MNRPLYERLPEIYRIKDLEQDPPGQLAALLEPVEAMFDVLDRTMVELYHDFFIETCADWAVPYLGAQLGVTPLRGDAWAQRADVADTMAIRRRKGTLMGLALAVRDLTGWAFRLREFFPDVARCQHIGHHRPDIGGMPAYTTLDRFTTPRGGTASLRAPRIVRQTGGPWEPLARTPDLRRADTGRAAVNLPNLGIFLWRLESYRLPLIQPFLRDIADREVGIELEYPNAAALIARFEINRLGRPQPLFAANPTGMDEEPPRPPDRGELPCVIPTFELDQGRPGAFPEKYVRIATYDATMPFPKGLAVEELALELNLPADPFAGTNWTLRGANLCAWEKGLWPPLAQDEIAIDPVIGRVIFGVSKSEHADSLGQFLRVTCHVGTTGALGALPENRLPAPSHFAGEATLIRQIDSNLDPTVLATALDDLHKLSQPLVIEILDSQIHDLDLTTLASHTVADGDPALTLNRSLVIRAATGQTPILRLAQPLAFRPLKVVGADADEQAKLDAVNGRLTVRLEGLTLTRVKGMVGPMITRAALNALEIWNCTLDPGGFAFPHEAPAPFETCIGLSYPYGFADPDEEEAFKETPQIILRQVLSGALHIAENYRLHLQHSIIHAGSILGDATPELAIGGDPSAPTTTWGPDTTLEGVTLFGGARLAKLSGKGALLPFPVEVQLHTRGCLKRSFIAAAGNRLPQLHDCVSAAEAVLGFTSQSINHPALGQLTLSCDYRLRERGPDDCAMGAFGFMQEAHKWRNLEIRFRELMPVGIRPVLIPMN